MREVPLTHGRVALVDDEDYERVMAAGPWFIAIRGRTTYAAHSTWDGKNRGTLLMHRLVLDVAPRSGVDHINMNGLDNRKGNLRLATKSQNGANQPKQRIVATSRYKGVSLAARDNRWVARIGRRRPYIGRFRTEEEAARAYDRAALTRWGEFAILNFPQGDKS